MSKTDNTRRSPASIRLDLSSPSARVTVDFAAGRASSVTSSGTDCRVIDAVPSVENRGEAVNDITPAADEVVTAYADALTKLADR